MLTKIDGFNQSLDKGACVNGVVANVSPMGAFKKAAFA
jgi:ribosomal protein S1